MPEAPEVLEETVTVEEDPGTPTSHVSIVTSEDGTTRRTETKVWLGPGGGQVVYAAAVVPFVEWAHVPGSLVLWWKTETTLSLPDSVRLLRLPNPSATHLLTRSPRQSRR